MTIARRIALTIGASVRAAHEARNAPRINLARCPYRFCEAGRVRYLSHGRMVDVECWHCNGHGTVVV